LHVPDYFDEVRRGLAGFDVPGTRGRVDRVLRVQGRAMLVWETAEQTLTDPLQLEFAPIWRAIPKVVFSSSLTTVEGNARLARKDVADEAAELKNQPGAGIVSVGGAGLAAELAEKDLIDEYRLFVNPVVLGGGTPYFPPLLKRLDLQLIETQAFSQVIYLRYRRG
jgi:dihydrofolate reductase